MHSLRLPANGAMEGKRADATWINTLAFVFQTLRRKYVQYEELLQTLVRVVDEELLQRVDVHDLEAENYVSPDDTDRRK